ncbi:molybdenum cofactor sulfurase [Thecamonas trahens ATCC 50062]|uniref:Molybdenum cofactor sulfurase n=1 Tax=Thecamonas trahens ATCC 50062 TaxID=461836 RepID=A0A0L0DNY0_THETB|nr:molybdenum cofactor sulfurase [Thecamonas trahens ATCC 50062]KNC54019.1 molybdenum cofactor sulfurase [Thecamonas trahens ATCC 50062]|eukprot:XP_013754034.1 molybdenum cofactor sulfurase [Thecamonas trahens ATCC 50062]
MEQVEASVKVLTSNSAGLGLLGNPHSAGSPSAVRTDGLVERYRERVLNEWFATSSDQYALIWMPSATAALSSLASWFAWQDGSVFAYSSDNHTSVLGMRALLPTDRQVATVSLASSDIAPWLAARAQTDDPHPPPSLLVYPLKSNFDGVYADPAWRQDVPGLAVAWDAAAALATGPVNLSAAAGRPHFVVFSAYKVIGHPTGLGGLLIRRDAASLLAKRYYGGGTVAAALATEPWVRIRSRLEAALEDGTLPFTSIAQLGPAMDALAAVGGLDGLGRHIRRRSAALDAGLRALVHLSGAPLVRLYSPPASTIITLNVLTPQGEYVGYSEVGRLAALAGIHLRTGCFCNPGRCQDALGLTSAQVKAHYAAGHVCWDGNDIIDGIPTGAVRLSLGAHSTAADVDALLHFFRSSFVHASPAADPATFSAATHPTPAPRLDAILVYPIKSAGPMSVTEWELGPRGLLYDREWLVVKTEADGRIQTLNQKKEPRLCLLRPLVDLAAGSIRLSIHNAPDAGDLFSPSTTPPTSAPRHLTSASRAPPEVSAWLSAWLGYPVELVRAVAGRLAVDGASPIGFANESPFLAVNAASVAAVNAAVGREPVAPSRFRPNFVFDTPGAPWAEDAWPSGAVLAIGPHATFTVVGGCTRCRMVCIDQDSAASSAEPLLTLHRIRRIDGRIQFGVHLASRNVGVVITVGDELRLEPESGAAS